MLLKRAADIAEALYSVPRPHSQLQALPSSPVHGSVMGLSSYPSQLGVGIGDPVQTSGQGKRGQIKMPWRIGTILHFCAEEFWVYLYQYKRGTHVIHCFMINSKLFSKYQYDNTIFRDTMINSEIVAVSWLFTPLYLLAKVTSAILQVCLHEATHLPPLLSNPPMALEEAWVEGMELYPWAVWVCQDPLASAVPPQTALLMVMSAIFSYKVFRYEDVLSLSKGLCCIKSWHITHKDLIGFYFLWCMIWE